MNQTDLKTLGWSVELLFPAVAHPDLNGRIDHHLLHNACGAAGDDHMVDCLADNEHPLPSGMPIDAHASFIATHDRDLLYLRTDGFRPGGGCANSAGLVTCNLNTLPSGATATALIVARPTASGALTDYVSVTSDASDPNTSNNNPSVAVIVNPAFKMYLPLLMR